jgi:hypothetical protein
VEDLPRDRRQRQPPLDPWQPVGTPPKRRDGARRREAGDGFEEGVPDRRLVQAAERRVDSELQGRGAVARDLDELIARRPAAVRPITWPLIDGDVAPAGRRYPLGEPA